MSSFRFLLLLGAWIAHCGAHYGDHSLPLEVPILLFVEGAPGVLMSNGNLDKFGEIAKDAYNYNSPCSGSVVQSVDFEDIPFTGTGMASRPLVLSGVMNVTAASLFKPETPTQRRNRRLKSKGKGKGKGGPPPDCRLTKSHFLLHLSEELAWRRSELEYGVDSISDVVEMEDRTDEANGETCDLQNEFISNVLVTFQGDPNQASEAQLAELVDSFIGTYELINKYNPDTCDPLFRTISEMIIVTNDDGRRRRLHKDGEERSLQSPEFAYLYVVRSQCARGCTENTRLFGEGTSGRQLSFLADTERRLQLDCVCPIDATQFGASSTDQFAESYGFSIEVLKTEQVIQEEFVEGVLGVKELTDCRGANRFETQIIIRFGGNFDNVTCASAASPGGKQELEDAFVTSYYQAADPFCDKLVRGILSVDNDGSGGSSTSKECLYRFTVEGSCEECGPETTLFSQEEGVTRRTISDQTNVLGDHDHRLTQEDDRCLCDLDFIDDRAPTAQEFEDVYNATVRSLGLAHIQYVVEVNEL